MDFYERKANYFKRVKKLIETASGKITRNDIIFDATENAALGEKSIFKYLDMLKDRGFITEKDGVLYDSRAKTSKKQAKNKQKTPKKTKKSEEIEEKDEELEDNE